MLYFNSENLKPETKVFRYMDLAKFLSLIHQKTIFFAKASSYEDSLEGMPTELDNFLGSLSAELLNITVESLFASFATNLDEDARKVEQEKVREAKFNHLNRTVSTVFGPLKVSEGFGYSSVIKAASNWVDISCWHTDSSDVESMAMWKIYGGGALNQVLAALAGAVTGRGLECVSRVLSPVPRQGNTLDAIVKVDVVRDSQACALMNGHEAVERFRLRDTQVHGHFVGDAVDYANLSRNDPAVRADHCFEGIDQLAVGAVGQDANVHQVRLTRIVAWVAEQRQTSCFCVVAGNQVHEVFPLGKKKAPYWRPCSGVVGLASLLQFSLTTCNTALDPDSVNFWWQSSRLLFERSADNGGFDITGLG